MHPRPRERLWDANGFNRLRYWPDRTNLGVHSDWFMLEATAREFGEEREQSALDFYRFSLSLGAWID